MSPDDLWWHLRPRPGGRQLVLVPFLGGFVASFHPLVDELGDDWDVWCANPPGHASSSRPPVVVLRDLVEQYARALAPVLRPGAVLLGHSLGAYLAHRIAALLAETPTARPAPSHLVLSAAAAPEEVPARGYHLLEDAELAERAGGEDMLSGEILADPSLLAVFLPGIRADFAVLDAVGSAPPPRVGLPTTLVLAAADPLTAAGRAEGWRAHCTGPLDRVVLRGVGHMHITRDPAGIAATLDRLDPEPSPEGRP
ncbi:thioesterase II family protein [Brachybacterium squillarum]|uniref:thioesterase II family protein n=1 Tax=Brachybacterium squillarum TaxID=661979 RepID=UPI00026299AC|nr:alpha/beta fold hydrolase [Brachybacterium squillarum]